MSSHILGEVAHTAERVAIIHAGRLVEEVALEELRRRAQGSLEIEVSHPDRALDLIAKHSPRAAAQRVGNLLRIPGGAENAADVARLLVAAGLDLTRLTRVEADLEAYFLEATGGSS